MKGNVIIIGSGLGGLECARILASEGYHVLILEREAQPGGCMQSYRRKGLEFDTGLHYVGGLAEGQALYAPFSMLGLLKLPWVRLDNNCFDRIHIAGRSFSFAQGYENFVDSLSEQFPSERTGLQEYADLLKESSTHQLDFLSMPTTTSESIGGEMLDTSAWQWLHEHFHDETLINVLSGNSTRMELRRDTLPLFTFAHINSSYIASSWRLKGSGRLMVDSLLSDIRANGGEVVCNAEVRQLIEKDGRIVKAVCADGEEYEADMFISDIHPMLTYNLIGESQLVRKSMRRRMRLLENTYGMLTVSLVIKPDTLPYVNHNEYIYRKANLWEGYEKDKPVSGVLISYRVPEGSSRYVRQIDIMTPAVWDECCEWNDTKVGHRGNGYDSWKQRKADECIRLAETVLPDLHDMIEAQYVSSPLTYRDYTLTPQGSAYGIRKDYSSPLLTVLSPRTPEPNLLLTGQSLMLHGVEGVTMTAIMTCAEILGKERVWDLLNKSL